MIWDDTNEAELRMLLAIAKLHWMQTGGAARLVSTSNLKAAGVISAQMVAWAEEIERLEEALRKRTAPP